MAAVGYLGPLFLVPLLGKKENAFCRYHGKQGAVLFGLEVIGAVVLIILGLIARLSPYSDWLVSVLLWVAYWVCALVLSIWGIVTASKGEYWKMPLIAPLADRMNF